MRASHSVGGRDIALTVLFIATTLAALTACAPGRGPSHVGHMPPERSASLGAREVTPSEALARRVATHAGVDATVGVAELRFRYVSRAGDGVSEGAVEAVHRWDVRGSRDHVTFSEGGHTYDLVVDLLTRRAVGTIDGQPMDADAAVLAGELGYARWLNDTYMLSLPATLLASPNAPRGGPVDVPDFEPPFELSAGRAPDREQIHIRFENVEVLRTLDLGDF